MPGLEYLMNNIELPLVPVVCDIEDAGYLVDAAHFHRLAATLDEQLDIVNKRVTKLARRPVNVNSPRDVAALLYDELELPVKRKTPTGKPSTDEGALRALTNEHAVVPVLVRARELTKIKSTYCSLPENLHADGRLRVEFNQLGARTGRFSCAGLIQTLPKKDEFAIRKGFVAGGGHTIVAADFEQQELRILAAVSGEKAMLKAIEDGVDLHGLAAVRVYNLACEPNEVEALHKDERASIKEIQFGIIYGSGPRSLADKLGITSEDASKLLADYFREYPAVEQLITKTHKAVVKDGYVDDAFGRRRYLPDAKLRAPRRKRWENMSGEEREVVRRISHAKRAAQNFIIQGAAATITKLAMLRCHALIKAEHRDIKFILTLHDELQFEVPDNKVAEFAAELPSLMCDLGLDKHGIKVPMAVSIKTGKTWGDLQPWKGSDVEEASTK